MVASQALLRSHLRRGDRDDAYQADNLTKNASGREGVEDVNSALEPRHGTAAIASEFVEILG